MPWGKDCIKICNMKQVELKKFVRKKKWLFENAAWG